MARLRVLISGAGIGGCALAFWLAKLNHDVTVVERHPCLRVNGLQLDLRGFGIEVMKRMGLEKIVRSKLVPEDGIALVDSTGRQRAFFAANKTGKGAQSITSEYEIMRRDLCQILHDTSVEKGAHYVFGTWIDDYEERDGTVKVKFIDGKSNDYDLVVGADGLGSRLRRTILAQKGGEVKDYLVELKERMAFFTIPKPIQEGEKYIGTAYLMTGKRFVLTRRHSPEEMQVYLACSTDYSEDIKTMRRGDVKTEKDAFTDAFQNSGWRTNELVKAMQTGAEDWYCQYTGFVDMPHWSNGHVTLVGDAAHGAPADGMGTSAALVGAYILAGEIERHYGSGSDATITASSAPHQHADVGSDKLLTAIEAYETRFRPYIISIHKGLSAEEQWFEKIPMTQFTINIIYFLCWLVCFLRLDLILARMMPIEGVKGWELPEYDMVRS